MIFPRKCGRWHFQNADGRENTAKQRPVNTKNTSQRPRFGMTLSTRLFRCLHNLHKERMSFVEKNPGPRGPGFSCGEIGIRTRDTILSYTRFPGVPLKPLEHLSNQFCISSMMIYVNEGANIGIIFRISFLLGKNLHFLGKSAKKWGGDPKIIFSLCELNIWNRTPSEVRIKKGESDF